MKLTTHFASARPWRASVVSSVAFAVGVWVAAAITASAAMAAGLNDTGFTTCADAAGALVSCTAASAVPGQDARYGRDAAAGTSALTKVGGGANGFDFTKISNAGAVLPATAPLGTAAGEWGCTYDNTTGLMWEVKTASGGLRHLNHSYTWYNSNAATNGGILGVANGGSCFATGRCDTEKFVQDVNATNMCGRIDWRIPSVRELFTLVKLAGPSIDSAYFPNTATQYVSASSPVNVAYWTSSPFDTMFIWTISFASGVHYLSQADMFSGDRSRKAIRLVRVGL